MDNPEHLRWSDPGGARSGDDPVETEQTCKHLVHGRHRRSGNSAVVATGPGHWPWPLAHRKHWVSPVGDPLVPRPRLCPRCHGILAIFWLFFAAFNLLALFLYRHQEGMPA